MNYGDKLVLRENKDLIEIVAVYPGAQGFKIESGEKYFGIVISGHIAYMPESLLNAIAVKYEPKAIEIKPTVSDVIEVVVKETPKKKKTKKVK